MTRRRQRRPRHGDPVLGNDGRILGYVDSTIENPFKCRSCRAVEPKRRFPRSDRIDCGRCGRPLGTMKELAGSLDDIRSGMVSTERGDEMPERPNFELAYEALEQIRLHPEQHDQNYFRNVTECGTTLCYAGWVCQLAGRVWVREDEIDQRRLPQILDYAIDISGFVHSVDSDGPDRTEAYGPTLTHAEDAARRLLRIDQRTSEKLFYEADDLHDLELIVKDLENEWADR